MHRPAAKTVKTTWVRWGLVPLRPMKHPSLFQWLCVVKHMLVRNQWIFHHRVVSQTISLIPLFSQNKNLCITPQPPSGKKNKINIHIEYLLSNAPLNKKKNLFPFALLCKFPPKMSAINSKDFHRIHKNHNIKFNLFPLS